MARARAPRQRSGGRAFPRAPRAPHGDDRLLAVASATTIAGLLLVGCGLALSAF